MNVSELQKEILKLKKENDICILAHSYQAREIIEIADYTGDSFQLSLKATETNAKTVLMCGVRFMAETVKILSPDKKVILANPVAGCPMAEQMDVAMIEEIKAKHPEYTVVAYINTTAALKTVCDVCVTSSSAENIVSKLPGNDILFIPDCNLGSYVAKNIPEKNIILLNGGCPTHASIKEDEVIKAFELYPNAKFLVHPECTPDVVKHAHYVGSTSGIMDYAIASPEKEFIIGTETSIAEHLSYICPDKKFYPLSMNLMCANMKITTLMDVYHALCNNGGEEIIMDQATIDKARSCIDKMIELG